MFFCAYIEVCNFNSKLSQLFVLSTAHIFHDLVLVLISDLPPPHPLPHGPLMTLGPPGRVLCTVLVTILLTRTTNLIEFYSIDNYLIGHLIINSQNVPHNCSPLGSASKLSLNKPAIMSNNFP